MESTKKEDTPPGEKPAEEEISIDSDEFMEKFSADPVAAVKELANMIADKKVAEQMDALTSRLEPVLKRRRPLRNALGPLRHLRKVPKEPEFSESQFRQRIAEYINQKIFRKIPKALMKRIHGEKQSPFSANMPLEVYLIDEIAIEKIVQNPAQRQDNQGVSPRSFGDRQACCHRDRYAGGNSKA
jgi:hypothetical protein